MKTTFATVSRTIFLGLLLGLLSGCLASGSSDVADGDGEPPANDGSGGSGNSNNAPTISGAPATSINAGQSYSFTPSASDPDGDSLTFSVSNLPAWASFNSSSGTVSGTPGDSDVGTYLNITITVSDGTATAQLQPFTVTVNQISMGSATLSWSPPTQNTDGTQLDNLAGYKIYYGVTQGSYPNSVTINNPGVTSYVVENLSPDTYYFVSTAFNAAGAESAYSNVATKVVN